jgi:hypothetical protein
MKNYYDPLVVIESRVRDVLDVVDTLKNTQSGTGKLRHELEQCESLLGKLYNVIGSEAYADDADNDSWQERIQVRRNEIRVVLKP